MDKGIESGTDRQPVTILPGLSPCRVSIVAESFFVTRLSIVGLWSDGKKEGSRQYLKLFHQCNIGHGMMAPHTWKIVPLRAMTPGKSMG